MNVDDFITDFKPNYSNSSNLAMKKIYSDESKED